MSYVDMLRFAAPELLVVVAALVVLAADLVALRGVDTRPRTAITAMLAGVGCLAAIGWLLALPQEANFGDGMLVVNPLTRLAKVALLVTAFFAVLLTIENKTITHIGEYLAVMLFGLAGMMFLVSTEDILMLFISLELSSLSLYILTALDKTNRFSTEAALKYFLFGGMSAALTLFGLSLLYGLSGATNFTRIAAAIHQPLDPLLLLAIGTTLAGLGFKVAAAPFHWWAPDVYQAAPAPGAALIASTSKIAGFFVLARVLMAGFSGAAGNASWTDYQPGWIPALALVAAASMVVGNLAAIVQTSVRRLLAYSAVAHTGYMLLAILVNDGAGLAPLVYYAATYGLATLGAFGVVAIVERWNGGERLTDFAGLSRRAPVLSLCLMVFMLSLAGIPPLAGFFGKFYVFSSALQAGSQSVELLWLVILALMMSAVSLYYYLQVLKQAYVAQRSAEALPQPAFPVIHATVCLLAAAIIVLGCLPGWFIDKLATAVKLAGL
jgi:NADH-quinone oxidoreductase subunit N